MYAQTVPQVSIITDEKPGAPVLHAIDKLTETLNAKHIAFENVKTIKDAKASQVIVAGIYSAAGGNSGLIKNAAHPLAQTSEALAVWKTNVNGKQVLVVAGYDDRGLMYALLDIATRISWSTNPKMLFSEIKEVNEKPAVSDRALSMYTMNRAYWESRMYDENYWAKYLDMLALDRFNTLVVIFGYENGGFLAPCYPYFFNVDGFSDVKMIGLSDKEQQHNLDAFNRLIKMAHDRGIRFTVGIWDHIYRGGVQGGGIPGTKESPDKPVPGLVWGVNADNLIPYTKAALAKFVKVFPDLDAIQFRMHDESGLKNGEQDAFWLDIFRMLKTNAPNLKLDLRAKELKESVIQSAINVGINFRITTKYWMEQMGLPFHPTQINPEKSPRRHSYSDLLRYPQQYKMHWRLWNGGTSRILLMGDPEYVRRFAASSHLYDGDGYDVNEPLATKMEAQPHDEKPFDLLNAPYRYYDYEFERYWHFFQVFGRVGYNPNTATDTWDKTFEQKFGARVGPLVETALHKASWILPRIISSSYPYSSFPTTRGWAEKQALGDLPAFADAKCTDLMQFATFDEEASLIVNGGATAKLLPSANSKWFEETSRSILASVNNIEKLAGANTSKELVSTITDLKILAGLAKYQASRIPAAVNYRIYKQTKSLKAFDEALKYEKKAISAWQYIVTSAGDVYTNDLKMGVRVADLCGHWKDELVKLQSGLQKLEAFRKDSLSSLSTANIPVCKVAATADNTAFFNVSHEPVKKAPAATPLTIRIKVIAQAGVKKITLRYRSVNQEQAYESLQMLPAKDANEFEATIPAAAVDPTYDFAYLFEIIDNKDRGMIYPDFNKRDPYFIVKLNR
jgi:hypothetical protein